MSDRSLNYYMVSAFDANGELLDVDPQDRREGYGVTIADAGQLLAFVNSVRTGLLHDHDNGTYTSKRVAYFELWSGSLREVWVTPFGATTRMGQRQLDMGRTSGFVAVNYVTDVKRAQYGAYTGNGDL